MKNLIITGRTGAGKTTVLTEVIKLLKSENIPSSFLEQVTTRKRREGEINSEYSFLSDEEFSKTDCIARFVASNGWVKYGVLKNNNIKGVGVFSPISLSYAVDTANGIGFDNVQFVIINLDREVRRERLLNRGEKEDSIQRRFDIEDLEGDYDLSVLPKDTLILSNPEDTPLNMAKKIVVALFPEFFIKKFLWKVMGSFNLLLAVPEEKSFISEVMKKDANFDKEFAIQWYQNIFK